MLQKQNLNGYISFTAILNWLSTALNYNGHRTQNYLINNGPMIVFKKKKKKRFSL